MHCREPLERCPKDVGGLWREFNQDWCCSIKFVVTWLCSWMLDEALQGLKMLMKAYWISTRMIEKVWGSVEVDLSSIKGSNAVIEVCRCANTLLRYGDIGMCSRMYGGILKKVWRRVKSSQQGSKTLNKVWSRSEDNQGWSQMLKEVHCWSLRFW
jgi:hypothetical protein